jgi:hypothetical protein
MIRAHQEPRSVLTSPALLERTADKHGVPVVVVDGYFAAVIYRPNGEAILWRAVVPAGEVA